jgi:enoyl-CoA hydratase/carnithine racemase
MVPAAEALSMGLVQQLVPDGAFAAEAERVARELAAKPPLALALAKRTLATADAEQLDAMLEREAEAQLSLFQSRDVREGIRAFREHRAAAFQGR